MRILKRIGLLLWLKILEIVHILAIIIGLGLMSMAIKNSRIFEFNFGCLVGLLILLFISWFRCDWKEVKRRIK